MAWLRERAENARRLVARGLRHAIELCALRGFSTTTKPPASCTSGWPREPRCPPDRTIAPARRPQSCASERKNTSMGRIALLLIALVRSSRPPEMIILLLEWIQIHVVWLDAQAVLHQADRQRRVAAANNHPSDFEVRRQCCTITNAMPGSSADDRRSVRGLRAAG